MRIVIDMQGAQTASKQRGIGRYTLALSKEMVRSRGPHEVILALNGLFPDTIDSIRNAFATLLPEENIRVWQSVTPVNFSDTSNHARRQVAELAREAFLASLQPDIVLNTSFFEGFDNDAITSIGGFTARFQSVVILYDLIPLIYSDIYLQNPVLRAWYLNKIEFLRHADLLLSISASSGKEAVDYLGFSRDAVVNISTACESKFHPILIDENKHLYLSETFAIKRPFVMYTGGIDHRKNIEGLIRAYATLPIRIRDKHQLVIVCSMQSHDRERLQQLAKKSGLSNNELMITGFVPEEDLLVLYNTCKLFVFPSWHEGFGLPILEAMACGRAVIGANRSSIPEVVGREDALFDPFDEAAIAQKIMDVLTQDDFRVELEQHGLYQAKNFSWEQTAHDAWKALEALVLQRHLVEGVTKLDITEKRLRLAYISPLPPMQSGISDYSAELLPVLSQYYEIEVIIDQESVSDRWVSANLPIHDVKWFFENAHHFDRILYHFGNSTFHSHMFELLQKFPGVVVLHDFFLSGILHHLEMYDLKPFCWTQVLRDAHGWLALQERYKAKNMMDVIFNYPCNLEVVQQALGIILHSEYSRRLAEQFYGPKVANDSVVIPLLRAAPIEKINRHAAREKLEFGKDDFVVCSFGILGQTKLNHRLLSAWLASPLANNSQCHLVFVGKNQQNSYGSDLVSVIQKQVVESQISITGWVDTALYRDWLSAADVAVQLRTCSRGETSAAVLDCMNYGLATVVNAHGSSADLPSDSVCVLPDDFSDEQLINVLMRLWEDSDYRRSLGTRAREIIHTVHQPQYCAEQYAITIEDYYGKASIGIHALIQAIAHVQPELSEQDLRHISSTLAHNFCPHSRKKQVFLDISALIENTVSPNMVAVFDRLLKLLLFSAPEGWVVEPVYFKDAVGYRYAHQYTSRYLGVNDSWANDERVEHQRGDMFLGLKTSDIALTSKNILVDWHRCGTKVFFLVDDVLARDDPSLDTICCFDGMLCARTGVYYPSLDIPKSTSVLDVISKITSIIELNRVDEYSCV